MDYFAADLRDGVPNRARINTAKPGHPRHQPHCFSGNHPHRTRPFGRRFLVRPRSPAGHVDQNGDADQNWWKYQ